MTPGIALDPARVSTLLELFDERVRQTPSRIAYRQYLEGVDRWHGYTWADIAQRVRCWQDALVLENLKKGDRVAIMASNRPDWVAIDIAALSLGLVTVALFTDDVPGSSSYTLRHSGARILVVEFAHWWVDIAGHAELPELQRIVSLSAGMPPHDDRAVNLSNWLPTPTDASSAPPARRPKPEDLAVICYTSGTTGRPRGVMLSHANILSNVRACDEAVPILPDDIMLSFLPLAHMFERTAGYYHAMLTGTEVAFTRGVDHLREDFADVRPTAIISVPRIFERFYALLKRRIHSRGLLLRTLFRWAVVVGWYRHQRRQRKCGFWLLGALAWPLLKRVIARPAMNALGGRLRVAISGGAPLAPEVARMFIALGLPVLQGYGLTEAGPVVSTNRQIDNDPESVGQPVAGVETKVGREDELLVRGPSVMQGYWDDPEATAAALSDDGWLATGDKVSRLQSDRIYVTGRIKELIVMSSGEKASPASIEQLLLSDSLVDQAMVLGEARPYLVALIVPDEESLAEFCAEAGVQPGSPELEHALLQRFEGLLTEMPKFSQLRRLALVADRWTVDNGMATPTQKLRRRRIMQVHMDLIDELYRGHFVAPSTDVGYHVDVG